jgi:hypothetical protein
LAGFCQWLQEVVAVHIREEDLLLAIAAAHDVIHGSGILEAQFVRHAATLSADGVLGQGQIETKLN